VQLIKARTTCDSKTGQVETVWLENAESVDGFLGKEAMASGSTKNIYQVSNTTLTIPIVIESHILSAQSCLLLRGSSRLVPIARLRPLRTRNT